jgi:hypothetical protein
MLVNSVAEFNAQREWFIDPARPERDNDGPFLLVIDDFYSDAHEIRRLARSQTYVQYSPPLAEQVGPDVAGRYPHLTGRWMSTALLTSIGQKVKAPFKGYRYNPETLKTKLEEIIGEKIAPEAWALGGDWWNGAFHTQDEAFAAPAIHHHYKPMDVEPRGWSGVVYLTPNAPASAGTSFWLDRRTGTCVASYQAQYCEGVDRSHFELAYRVENTFNRLVLFRENVWHRGGHGFGAADETRLTQTGTEGRAIAPRPSRENCGPAGLPPR